jgi:hypothetical protein
MMFHVKPYKKTLGIKGVFLFFALNLILSGCSAPRQLVDVSDHVLMKNGKPVLGNDGLTAFIFENNPRKIPFQQFVANKYDIGKYVDVEYWTIIERRRFKVMVYENVDLEKYFDTSNFVAANVEPDVNVVGSKAKFIAVSVISEFNEDCLADGSLYQNMIINYLRNLKKEYYNS